MVKRFYQSCNSFLFSLPMTSLAFAIFVEAFLMTSKKDSDVLRILLYITTALLVIVMIFYYKNKIGIYEALKKVDNVNEYLKGGMCDRSYILEERMLVCRGLKIRELSTTGIHKYDFTEEKNKYVVHLTTDTDTYEMTVLNKEEGARLAAFLKRKNSDIMITGTEPSGNGTLQELGAE